MKDPAYEIDSKDDTHAWAQSLGVRTPRLLGTYASAGDIDWSDLPDRVVLKPTRASSSAGVFLLTRGVEGWTDCLSDRVLAPAGIVSEVNDMVARGLVSRSVLLEEFIEDPRVPGGQPIDYKVSMFFGRVGLIEAKAHRLDDRGQPQAAWRVFDENWTDIGNVFLELDMDSTIPPPVHRDELLDIARRVSAAVPRAYLRVDMLDSADGPVLGEVTPEPGGDLLPPPRMDRLLGQYWEDAEVRLRMRAARAGVLTPTIEPLEEATDLRPLKS